MKFGASSWPFQWDPPYEDCIRRVAGVGFKAIELIAWNKDFISLAEFIDRLKTYKVQEPDGRILINGDEGALFNAALYVFDEARKTGFTKVFIETKVRAAGK